MELASGGWATSSNVFIFPILRWHILGFENIIIEQVGVFGEILVERHTTKH